MDMNDLEKPNLKNEFRMPASQTVECCCAWSMGKTCYWCDAGRNLFAAGAYWTHYHGPLADGLVVDDEVLHRHTLMPQSIVTNAYADC
jgi:hypothetical protein